MRAAIAHAQLAIIHPFSTVTDVPGARSSLRRSAGDLLTVARSSSAAHPLPRQENHTGKVTCWTAGRDLALVVLTQQHVTQPPTYPHDRERRRAPSSPGAKPLHGESNICSNLAGQPCTEAQPDVPEAAPSSSSPSSKPLPLHAPPVPAGPGESSRVSVRSARSAKQPRATLLHPADSRTWRRPGAVAGRHTWPPGRGQLPGSPVRGRTTWPQFRLRRLPAKGHHCTDSVDATQSAPACGTPALRLCPRRTRGLRLRACSSSGTVETIHGSVDDTDLTGHEDSPTRS